jgi:cytochrome P450
MFRVARRDVELGGSAIPAGRFVLPMLDAAVAPPSAPSPRLPIRYTR